jgi:hypothetical protein
VSRITDLIQRHAAHHHPIDLHLLDAIIWQERWSGSLTIHYHGGRPKLLSAGKPIVVEVESPPDPPARTSELPLASSLTKQSV